MIPDVKTKLWENSVDSFSFVQSSQSRYIALQFTAWAEPEQALAGSNETENSK
jgi:hypothetical protein